MRKNPTADSIIYQLNQCSRDAEQIVRRCAELVGTLSAYACTRGGSRGVAREACARVPINLNSININSVCDTSAAEAATHTQPISLGGLFRQLPKRVPESYALWWWRYMKDREWQLTNGRCVTAKTWRVTLITFYNAAKSGELADAKEEYERFFGKAFPRQEETAAEEWEEKCRGRRDLFFDK